VSKQAHEKARRRHGGASGTPGLECLFTRYNYDDWRTRAKSFTGMAAFRSLQMTLTSAGEPERVPAKMITASLLPLLGVTLQHGRHFTEAEDRPGGGGVAIVSASVAQHRFGGAAIGNVLLLDNQPYTIVGIMPANFELFQPADV
jgi:hypothetical protein